MKINLAIFSAVLRPYGVPIPWSEWVFDPSRKWRFDFAWPDVKLAVEIDGGNWSGGAHVRPARMRKTREKENRAACLGWAILRFAPEEVLRTDAMKTIKEAYDARQSDNSRG